MKKRKILDGIMTLLLVCLSASELSAGRAEVCALSLWPADSDAVWNGRKAGCKGCRTKNSCMKKVPVLSDMEGTGTFCVIYR